MEGPEVYTTAPFHIKNTKNKNRKWGKKVMSRVYNFSAGPAVPPEEVPERKQQQKC